jgi:hypothetical protein|eukprot:SAG25_NODE_42_length_19413_cov_107.539609_13_plen_90_part_00
MIALLRGKDLSLVVPIADTGVCINNRRQTAHPTRACLHFAPTEISRLGNNVFIGHAAEGHTQSACGLGQRGHSAAEASFSAGRESIRHS